MPTPTRPTSTSKVLLTIFADAGAFLDLGDRLKKEYPNPKDAPKIDLLKVPSSVEKEVQKEFKDIALEAPKEGRILYNLGATSAGTFHEKMAEEWSVQTLPLGMCKYDRATTSEESVPPFRIRFHAPIAYALGYLAGKQIEPKAAEPRRDHLAVVVVTDDAQLVSSLADARMCGLDARLAWFTGSLSPDVSHYCTRNNVPVMLIEPTMVADHAPKLTRSTYGAGYLNAIVDLATPRR